MRPTVSPGVTWEVRLAWGTRPLAAALVSPSRPRLTLGNAPEDDVDTGHPARLELALDPGGALSLSFSAGVEGLVSVQGDAPAALGTLVARGLAVETRGRWRLVLRSGDAAELLVGNLSVHLRQARGRFQALPFDGRHLVALGVALALLLGFFASSLAQVESTLKYLLPAKRPPAAPRR
jgi:hypothetical protein